MDLWNRGESTFIGGDVVGGGGDASLVLSLVSVCCVVGEDVGSVSVLVVAIISQREGAFVLPLCPIVPFIFASSFSTLVVALLLSSSSTSDSRCCFCCWRVCV